MRRVVGHELRTVTAVTLLGLVLAPAMTGCRQESAPSDYKVITGKVVALSADTESELTVRPDKIRPEDEERAPVSCLLTNDSEIYVNYSFSTFDAIVIGDTVELIGYRQSNVRGERFVVSEAHITRNEPLPPPPDLSLPTTQPSEPAKEK